MKDQNDYNVRAVERALKILACFDDEHTERGISEIAYAVELHKATAHRIVTTLVNFGFLERSAGGQKYRLGLELANLGFKVIRRLDLRREARPFMKELVQKWDETCDLSIFDQGEVFYIEVLRGNRALTIAAAVGQRLPAHCTASGKLFLAHLTGQELDEVLSRPLNTYTDRTVNSPFLIREQLEKIRQQGYAVDNEEIETGVYAIAAPIYNRQGVMIAAISIPSPVSRMTAERNREIADSLLEASRAISRRMGSERS
jgi:IclR family KDG regulon transcriptional repressor